MTYVFKHHDHTGDKYSLVNEDGREVIEETKAKDFEKLFYAKFGDSYYKELIAAIKTDNEHFAAGCYFGLIYRVT